jgi:Zn finger protein HypA/HybF involved in hydrogenase expression
MRDREPSAIITVAGSERKIYENDQIYLQNGENFEIRFFNPLQEKIGVEIIFNGINKNDGYLILNPGQDIILDRFLGEQKKMLFETYKIDASNPVAVEAAKSNGLIKFNFYKEQVNHNIIYTNYYYYSNPINGNFGSGTLGGNYYHSTDTTPIGNYGTLTSDINYSDNVQCSTSRSFSKSIKASKSIETGRIEKGENSAQQLKTVNCEFEYFPFHSISYLLLPNSAKLTEVREIRNYCDQCSYRIRKQTWKYCPKCGNKLD